MYPGELTLWQLSAPDADSSVRHLTTGTISGIFAHVSAVPTQLHTLCMYALVSSNKRFLGSGCLWRDAQMKKIRENMINFFSCVDHHTAGPVDMTPHFTAIL